VTSSPDERSRGHTTAVSLANTRALIGLAGLLGAGPAARGLLGVSTPATRALVRMVAVRDLAVGLGTATTLREALPAGPGAATGPGWVSWGAVADAVDGAVLLLTPGLPRRARLLALVAGTAAAAGLALARRLTPPATTGTAAAGSSGPAGA
jgi:hypothetical protein